MKTLFTGPLLNFSGFAHASRNVLRALNESGMELTARPLTYDRLDAGQKFQPEDWLKNLLKNDLQNVDMAIQMTTCNVEAVPIPGICNGLYTFLESDRLQVSWAQKAEQFDFLMVPCKHNAQAMARSGVTKPILVVPPPCDTDVYKKNYPPFKIDNSGDRTIFYNICQLSQKKGIDALLRAYYAAFADSPDEVLLVLKTYVNMTDRSQDEQVIKEYINRIKMSTRIPTANFPPVMPIVGTLTDDEIHGLHQRGHAYVCSSRAEGWGIPVFDALGHGNTVISNASTGLEGFVRNTNSLVYGGTSSFFFDMPHPDPGLFTGVEQCFEPSPAEMAFVMKKYHMLRQGAMRGILDQQNQEEWNHILLRQQNAVKDVETFDYRTTHGLVVPQLEAAYKSWKTKGTVEFEDNQQNQEPVLEDTTATT